MNETPAQRMFREIQEMRDAFPNGFGILDGVKAELAEKDATITALRAEVDRLRQGIWDMCITLGFDNDGDPTPRALVSDIVRLGLDVAKDMRESYDEALDELP